MTNNTIGEFLKHAEPDVLSAISEEMEGPVIGYLQWRIQKRIASGEVTHHVAYEEAVYGGNYTAPDLAEWLSQYDSSWTVDMGDYGDHICVIREVQLPYTEEEVAAANKFIEEYPEPDTEYIRFRASHD